MKIVLAEENESGEQKPEQSFNQAVIHIGRDSFECDIAFENTKYPMVSRKHAELLYQNGVWTLIDLNSSYGTFVDGQKIVAPHKIVVGSRLQFGIQGPVLRVLWFEVASDSVHNFTPPESLSKISLQNAPVAPQKIAPTPGNPPQNDFSDSIPDFDTTPKPADENNQSNKPETARLEFVGDVKAQTPFELNKQSVWLGRDTNCDIKFEASAAVVSRRHAEIRLENGNFTVYDNGSFNGTLINGQRISAPTPLYHDDKIELGIGGPVLRFNSPSRTAPQGASLAGQRSIAVAQLAVLLPESEHIGSKTMFFKAESPAGNSPENQSAQPQLLMSLAFGDKKELIIGRTEASDIKLDGLQISNRHARLLQTSSGVTIEDLNSTNGVYLNGRRISRRAIAPNEAVQIGSFLIQIDAANNISVFDTRSKMRIDAVGLTKDIKNRAGEEIRLLDNISLSIQPNEFIGLLGQSGAGKSLLMNAMNGMRRVSTGSVLINNLDLYQNLDALKQSIGHVPQDDIIHRELTVDRTLFYVAKLRLSRDVSVNEINQIINEVLDVTGLSEKRNVPVGELSGGQRKRVSIAVELVTKPSVIFLDEPTSGLDPATGEKIMRLFRQIAESGRTVILTTHAMENIKLFDKIVILMRGRLAFYGTPDEALKYFNAGNFKELYDKLEEPIEQKIIQQGESKRQQITEQTAEEWKQKFTKAPQYKRNIAEPLRQLGKVQSGGAHKKNRLGIVGAIRQTATLSRRYAEVLFKDKSNLFILLAQAPVIAVLTFFVMGANQPRDFVYFVLSLVAVWFGTSLAAREIVRERAIYRRERMVNLGILPYLASKLFVLGIIVGLQCLLLFMPLKFFDLIGVMPMPGETYGIPQFWTMILTAGVGVALGLLISALVKTSEMATSLVPLILIPQILFSGLVGVPGGASKAISLMMPAAWSFDTMKRFSTLDTLEQEGAEPNGKTRGLGLYKYIEAENEKIIAGTKRDLDEYKIASGRKLSDFETEWRNGRAVALPDFDEPPEIPEIIKIPENLSRYVTFLHPWMNEILNQIVLMVMFFILFMTTLFVLRLKDSR
jgi:ABC-type multidrug transport system ATPase subunit/predicted component of type VI protein secretion system